MIVSGEPSSGDRSLKREPPQNAVVLPCSTAQFGEFISSLLGKPQTLSNRVNGPFEVNKDDVLNLHALLIQRISQQNDGVLTRFTAKMVMDDHSSVLLNSVEDFSAYNEIRPTSCFGLHLSWVFLVRFNDKSHPEKQQVDVSFIAGGESVVIDHDGPFFISPPWSMTGYISYRIAHTARTWGSDIDALLNAHLKGLVDEIPSVRKWLARHAGKISTITSACLFLASVIATYYATMSFVAGQKAELRALGPVGANALVTPGQMKYLLDTVAAGTWDRFLLYSAVFLLFSLVVSILIGVWISATADNLPPSFLLLTRESHKRKARIVSGRRKIFVSFVASQVVTFLVGIGVNAAYAVWFQKLLGP